MTWQVTVVRAQLQLTDMLAGFSLVRTVARLGRTLTTNSGDWKLSSRSSRETKTSLALPSLATVTRPAWQQVARWGRAWRVWRVSWPERASTTSRLSSRRAGRLSLLSSSELTLTTSASSRARTSLLLRDISGIS